MKNIEKYTNTKDALEAYNQHKSNNVPFDKWLECEFEEPRKPTLLEAAQSVIKARLYDMPDVSSVTFDCAISNLVDAVEREKRKPVRNCDKYKTADEASKAFTLMCDNMSCQHCPYNQGRAFKCKFTWLYATAEKEETK